MWFFSSTWYRNRAVAFAILFTPLLLWMSYSMSKARNNVVVAERKLTGKIENTELVGKAEYKTFETQIRVPNGELVTMRIGAPPVPRIGQEIPVIQKHFKEGEVEYRLDRPAWTEQQQPWNQPAASASP